MFLTILATLTDRLKLSLVSYWNTKPFLYGLRKTGLIKDLDVQLDIPSVGGRRLLLGVTDIALAPVITLNSLPKAKVITNYCIGAIGPVQTVCLFSNVEVKNIKKILLDSHSMTSVKLVKVLTRKWGIDPEFVSPVQLSKEDLGGETAALVIGDKAFGWHGSFKFTIDLADAWIQLTGKPFVFAAWIALKPISEDLEFKLNAAFETGLENIMQWSSKLKIPK